MRQDDARKLDHATLEAMRIRAVRSVQAGENPEVVARSLRISRRTIYGWLAQYRRGGWGALKAKPLFGRPPDFFSFEKSGIAPDIVCLAKSIGGIGLPLAILLIKPEYDQWAPGEHNGTFRGNNLAFVAGASALQLWRDTEF